MHAATGGSSSQHASAFSTRSQSAGHMQQAAAMPLLHVR
jgi:hypothetical protein